MEVSYGGYSKLPSVYYKSAAKRWWRFLIARKFHISPLSVDEWPAEDVLEALAFLEMTKPKEG